MHFRLGVFLVALRGKPLCKCCTEVQEFQSFLCLVSQVGNAAFHNDSLYEELRRSISPLTKLLHSTEDDVTKSNAAGALSNLVRYSDKLCDDIIRTGAIKVSCQYILVMVMLV